MNIITKEFINYLMMATIVSTIIMATIQKIKALPCITCNKHITILNLILSFLIGIPFSITFFDINLSKSIWVSLFSFIEAPSIYQFLKKQNIINYKPYRLEDKENNSQT